MADTTTNNDASSLSMTPAETTKLSKLLAYVLRHGAAKEKLTMRSDGYLLLSDLVLYYLLCLVNRDVIILLSYTLAGTTQV